MNGHIAVGCDSGLLLFGAGGGLVPSFTYDSVLEGYNYFSSLAFDTTGRLLAVPASYSDMGIQVISTTSGDLLSTWSNGVAVNDVLAEYCVRAVDSVTAVSS